MPEFKRGSNDQNTGNQITPWQQWAYRYSKSYAEILGPIDGYFGDSEEAYVKVLQRKAGVPITGRFDDVTAAKVGYNKGPWASIPVITPLRPIWGYSAAGTGGRADQGPQYEIGKLCMDILRINHQPLEYPAGGFLGLMGGDPGISYLESIANLDQTLERALDENPDIKNRPDVVEFWFFGYSQSADAIKRSVARLFGDGGKYAHLRSRINGLVLCGDPTRTPGPTRVGNNPYGWGISRWDAPEWLDQLTWSITTHYDLYACTTDDTLVKFFYPWFIRAETDLPFVVYSAKIIIPAILNFIPIVGGLLGPAAAPALAGLTGVGIPFLNLILGAIGVGGDDPDPELIKLLSLEGILTNLPQLIKTLIALQGIQTHGEYHLPKAEFGGRTGIQVGYDAVASFRR